MYKKISPIFIFLLCAALFAGIAQEVFAVEIGGNTLDNVKGTEFQLLSGQAGAFPELPAYFLELVQGKGIKLSPTNSVGTANVSPYDFALFGLRGIGNLLDGWLRFNDTAGSEGFQWSSDGTTWNAFGGNDADADPTNEIQNVTTNRGLERDASNNFGLLASCTASQILKWNGTGWACADDNSGDVSQWTTLTGGINYPGGTNKVGINDTNLGDSEALLQVGGSASVANDLGVLGDGSFGGTVDAGGVIARGGNIVAQSSFSSNWKYEPGNFIAGHSAPRCTTAGTGGKLNCDIFSSSPDCGGQVYDIGTDPGTAPSTCYDWYVTAGGQNEQRAYNRVSSATTGGWVSGATGYSDSISIGGDSSGNDLEVKINAPATRNQVTFTNQTTGTKADINAKKGFFESLFIADASGIGGRVLTSDGAGNASWQPSSSGADQWGTQVVVRDASLKGNGTTASLLGVDMTKVAALGTDGKVLSTQLPALAITDVFVKSLADVDTAVERTALGIEKGDVVIDTTALKSYIWDGTAWQELKAPNQVTSVNGLTGAVTISTDDADASPTNEAQTLTYTNSTRAVSLSAVGTVGGGSFTLPQGSKWTDNVAPVAAGINYTAGNVGIGTASPGAKLTVNTDNPLSSTNPDGNIIASFTNTNTASRLGGTATGDSRVLDITQINRDTVFLRAVGRNIQLGDGNVGIGTADPKQKLHVAGGIRVGDYGNVTAADGNGRVNLYSSAVTNTYLSGEAANRITLHTDGIRFYTAPAGTADGAVTWGNPKFTISNSGNVGIGTTPLTSATLTVGGSTWIDNALTVKGGIGAALNAASVPQFTITPDGKVGIGTNAPATALSVRDGDITIQNRFRSPEEGATVYVYKGYAAGHVTTATLINDDGSTATVNGARFDGDTSALQEHNTATTYPSGGAGIGTVRFDWYQEESGAVNKSAIWRVEQLSAQDPTPARGVVFNDLNSPTSFWSLKNINGDFRFLNGSNASQLTLSQSGDLTVAGNLKLNRGRSVIFTQGDNATTHVGGVQFLTYDNGITNIWTPTDQNGITKDSTIRLGGLGAFNSNIVNLGVSGNVGIGTLPTENKLEVVGSVFIKGDLTIEGDLKGIHGKSEFTSAGTAPSFVVPPGVRNVDVILVGGGGGGGDGNRLGGGSGGGGGGITILPLPVEPGQEIIVNVGAGGAGGTSVTYTGAPGGDTTITVGGKTYTAYGGKGGPGSGGNGIYIPGGLGIVSGGAGGDGGGDGTLNYTTGPGADGVSTVFGIGGKGMVQDASGTGGGGGGASWGNGGSGGVMDGGSAAPNSGGGGQGGHEHNTTHREGGDGGSGFVRITY